MSPTCNECSAVLHVELVEVLQICNLIIFSFYPRLHLAFNVLFAVVRLNILLLVMGANYL